MENKTYIWLTVGISLIVLTSAAPAQDEQWLQYHSARDSWQLLGDIGTSNPEVVSEKPQEVELPDFKCDERFFARWPTPMVASGGLWMAFDRKSKDGPHDLLYMDLNGNGSLADESVLEAYERDERNAKFEPVKILFDGEDGPTTYHLNVKFYRSRNRTSLGLWPAGWYEGAIKVAGKKSTACLLTITQMARLMINRLKPPSATVFESAKKVIKTLVMLAISSRLTVRCIGPRLPGMAPA